MINNSYLLGLFGASSGLGAGMSAPNLAPTVKKQPTAPWSTTVVKTEQSELVREALRSRNLISESDVDLDVKSASSDYRKLFALYQGLTSLSALATRAGEAGVTSTELAQLRKRFASGLAEASAYVGTTTMEEVRLVQGRSATSSKTTAGVEKANAVYQGAPIHKGLASEPVKAFEGDVRFTLSLKTIGGLKTLNIDLADLGDKPRTMDAVIGHINTKLSEAGVATRFAKQQIKAEPRTIAAGSQTITLPAGPDQWSLKINGVIGETLTLSAPDTSDAVYVVQKAGAGGTQQVVKFQSDGGTADPAQAGVNSNFWVEGQAARTDLPEGVAAVRASATAPDGSIWMVADLDQGLDAQPIKGQSDVALLKVDKAGRVVSSQVLGAASQANGYALAVAPDGRVAVAGSVIGALDDGKSGDAAGVADSFVSVFDASGKEQWTQRRGARAADEATAVSFGADGVVYVAGRAKSAMSGASAIGGWDGYVQAYSSRQANALAPFTATNIATRQFGSTGDDSVQAMTVSGSDLYTAGIENGRAVVRRFTLDEAGRPTLAATRDLGQMRGEIAGLAVENGRLIVAGATTNPALDAGTITTAASGGLDAFVASLSADLQASGTDRLTYYGGAGDDTAADVKITDGKVWITGVADRAPTAKATDPTRAYLARIDPETGAVEYSRTWRREGDQAAPSALAVVENGASVLDRLGLPSGQIAQSDPKYLTLATSLRVGDQFSVARGDGRGRATNLTITATDTLETLARRIETAAGRQVKVAVTTDSTVTPPVQRLSITGLQDKGGAIITSGPAGKDALAGLGLKAGYVGFKDSGDKDAIETFGLNLSNTLSLDDAAAVKTASEAILAALSSIRSAYRSLAPESATPPPSVAAGSSAGAAYWNSKASAYQAALSRLTA